MSLMWLLGRGAPIAAMGLAVFVFVHAVLYVRKAFFGSDE